RQTQQPEPQRHPSREEPHVQAADHQEVRKPGGGEPLAHGGVELGAPAGDERLDERRAMAEQRGGTRREPIAQRSPSAPLGVEEAHPAQREDPAIHGAQPPAGDDPGGAPTGCATVGPAPPPRRPPARRGPNAMVIQRSGGRTGPPSGAGYSVTGFVPQRGAAATLRKPSSSTTSSFAFSWSVSRLIAVMTSPSRVET